MNITTIQKEVLKKYNIPMLLLIDAKITEIGYEANYERVNPAGRELERLYDELYDQN